MNKFTPIIFTCLLLALPAALQAEVKPSGIFSDNMVLQRDCPVPVWGTASPGEAVTVSFWEQTKKTTADTTGRWMVKLDPMKASAQPRELRIGAITRTKVLVGDIWLCSGQSNMEMLLEHCQAREDIDSANIPNIRRIKFERYAASRPVTEVTKSWEVCTPNVAASFTAAGFYFARTLQQETGVPIGLIDSNWGGTRIEAWTAPCGFAMEPSLAYIGAEVKRREQSYGKELGNVLDDLERWLVTARKARDTPGQEIPLPPNLPKNPYDEPSFPSSIYYGQICPITSFAIKGAIWYQGESNEGAGDEKYDAMMRALIVGWRQVWNQGDFPFYFVQLANYMQPNENPAGGDGWARLRMAQFKSLQIPHTGMAVAIDLADPDNPNNIHPKNKCDVGRRLALWALAKDYGRKDLVCSGPLYKSMKRETGTIRLEFDSVGRGLMVATKTSRNPAIEQVGGKLKRFAITGEDKKWAWADAVIDGNTVVVSNPGIADPVAVRYAYTMNPAGANLYNRDGLPASPFRTDDWK